MIYAGKTLVNLAIHKKWSALVIAGLCLLVAYSDYLTPPEVPVDALYCVPVWLGLAAYGLYGGLAVSGLAVLLFYLANYILSERDNPHILLSVALTAGLLFLFCYGAYRYLQNQRRLREARLDLQARLDELDRLNRQAQELHEQNLRLAVLDERNRIAREIHDVLAQGFTAIILQVEAAHLHRTDPVALEERLEQIDRLARYNLQEARRSVANLRPLPLDSASLVEALERQVAAFQQERGIQTTFSASGEARLLPGDVEAALFRVTQEALNNVGRHSAATNIQVALDYDEDEVCLTVQDNGRGFDPAAKKEGPPTYGLKTMQERARLCGGWISTQAAPGEGCRIRLIVPYHHSGDHPGEGTRRTASAPGTGYLPLN